MHSTSAAFAAAVTAPRRQPITRVEVDWDGDGYGGPGTIDDLSPLVVDWEIDEDLVTHLPAEVRQYAGQITATATVTLAGSVDGDPRHSAPWLLSDTNSDSPLYGKTREGRLARIQVGFITEAGQELLTRFTGRVRAVELTRQAGQVLLHLEDLFYDLSGRPDLPTILADDLTTGGGVKPNLSNTFLVDWIVRHQLGRYLSPPPRAGCKISATLHGSCFPEIGDMNIIHSVDFEPPSFRDGPFLQALDLGGHSTTRVEYLTRVESGSRFNFRMGPGRHIALECWIKTAAAPGGLMMVTSGTNGQALFVNGSGNLAVYLRTPDSGPHIITTNLSVADDEWHYVGLHVAYGTNTCSITVRRDADTAVAGTPAGFNNTSTTPQPAMTVGHVGRAYADASSTIQPYRGRICAVQVSEENVPATGWYDTWSISDVVITPSRNRLVCNPVTNDATGREILRDLAESEGALCRFDDEGRFLYLTRDALTQPPYTTVQRVLTTSTAVQDLATTRDVATVRNRVVATGVTPAVLPSRDVWQAQRPIMIPASSSRTIPIGFSYPVANLDTTPIYAGASVGLPESRYRAARTYNGGTAVSNLLFDVAQFGDYAFVTITNPNPFDVWLVNPAGLAGVTQGLPALALYGTPVSFDQDEQSSQVKGDSRDLASRATYGEQVLQLPDSPWRQHDEDVEALTDDLVAQLAAPQTIAQDIPIVADPRLQLIDLVTLTDDRVLKLTGHFRLVRSRLRYSAADGLSQTIAVRST